MAPGDLRDLITDGVIDGVGGVVMFLPQILILFFFIGLLENTGYMARAAFIMDRLMSSVGLHGKSFIPAAQLLRLRHSRHHGDAHDRESEGPARHHPRRAVHELLGAAAGLPADDRRAVPAAACRSAKGRHHAADVRARHAGAFAFAWLFKRTLLQGRAAADDHGAAAVSPAVAARTSSLHMLERGCIFLRRAGTIILGISIMLWFLPTYPEAARAGRHRRTRRSSTASPARRAT